MAIDAHRSTHPGVIDVHTHAIDDDLPDLRQAYPHDRWPSIERTSDTEALLMIWWGSLPPDRSPVLVTRCPPGRHGPPRRCRASAFADSGDVLLRGSLRQAQPNWHRPKTSSSPGSCDSTRPASLRWALFPYRIPIGRSTRCAGACITPGFLGVEVGTQVCGSELADPSLDRFFAVAHELGALVLVCIPATRTCHHG